MTIKRVESLAYGADDITAGVKFHEDLGLEKVESGANGATFRTPSNQFIYVRKSSDTSLPTAPEGRNAMCECTWGVDSAEALEALGAELAKDRQVRRDADGTLHTQDETGNQLAFRVTTPAVVPLDPVEVNLSNINVRINTIKDRNMDRIAKPLRIGHVVWSIPENMKGKASDFYLNRLGFRMTDRSKDLGDFMRVPGRTDHHNIFLLHRANQNRFDHVAFEVHDFDELMVGGHHMTNRGWKAVTRPGRHMVGSNLFWYFQTPCGGKTEFFNDIDIMDDDWVPQVHEKHPGWAIWEFDAA
jgi:Glyoxalase/Bleomycin resistance protein/Dioxygenase superfamily